MSTVIIVGLPPLSMIGTDNTDSIVTKARSSRRASRRRPARDNLDRMRKPLAPRLRRRLDRRPVKRRHRAGDERWTNGVSFHTKVTMMPRQSRQARELAGFDHPERIERMLALPFCEEGAHALGATINGTNSGQRRAT